MTKVRVDNVLLHEIHVSHNHKISNIAFLHWVNLPHKTLKPGVNMKGLSPSDKAKIIQNRHRTQIYLIVCQVRPSFYNRSRNWLQDLWLKSNKILKGLLNMTDDSGAFE